MTFEEAVKKSIKAYFEGQQPDTLHKALGGAKKQKYTKKYFDKITSDMLPKKDVKPVGDENA